MEPPCPPHWTFAARAAYFGDRMCPCCDHRTPADAKFCNDCASPLHLKPCNRCNGVNDQAATNCYDCGAAFPASSRTPDPTQVLPFAHLAPARATLGDGVDTATETRPPFAYAALRSYRALLRPGLFLIAALATILIVAAHTTHYINAVAPDAMEVVSEAVGAGEPDAASATPTVATAMERGPVEPETAAAAQAPIPAVDSDGQKRASVRQPPVTAPATKRAGAHRRPAPERRTLVGAAVREAHGPSAAPVRVPVAEASKNPGPDRWHAMYASLARCSGDVSARIVCDERVRRQFCEGHWNNAPACANGVFNDRGQ